MWNIVFYTDHRGKCPPLEFINELPFEDQVRVRNVLRLLKEFGTALGMPHSKHIKGKLWELRPGGLRLFYFAFIDQQFVILHGYRKKSPKAPEGEIKIAMHRMNDLLDEDRHG